MELPEPDLITYAWYPRGVDSTIASGSNSVIGAIDESTVLKYPQLAAEVPADLNPEQEKIYRFVREQQVTGIHVEEQIFGALGEHCRIVSFKGKHEDGILLEYMSNGSLADYLPGVYPQTKVEKRLRWALQAAEAVAYIHTKRVIHCDISPGNFLLDKDLNLTLNDFQGRLLNSDGTILLNGYSAEGPKATMPRSDPNEANEKTDIFALGSAIYFVMNGHPPFLELNSWHDRREIESRFEAGQLPALDDVLGGDIVRKCWAGEYGSAYEVVRNLERLDVLDRHQI